jgi:hypothetical protein
MTAQGFVAAIRANVDAMYDDHITMEQFRHSQRRLWSEIERAGLDRAVCSILSRTNGQQPRLRPDGACNSTP